MKTVGIIGGSGYTALVVCYFLWDGQYCWNDFTGSIRFFVDLDFREL